ncbi:carbonic anhydrase 3-like isoform X2 [Ambystoma mexicanum]|uniref:carbonic anhydrase 3-like isoform X2 n=1 Tax=Ambystoma mexicanum TaxID=8296 RepID=UPI0037E91C6D
MLFIHSNSFLFKGPSQWYSLFPIAKGDHQSPIDINTKEANYDATLTPLNMSYDASSAYMLHNNGRTFNLEFDDYRDKSVLSGGPLPGIYRLKQMHIHWGSSDDHGSEHTVDGVPFAAELHLCHWNSKYGSFSEAAKHRDGLGVIALFLKGKEAIFTDYNPSVLLPESLDYWTYHGSLTTPPLLESIVWIVLREPITVSVDQMEKLRGLYFNTENETPCRMVNNFRPPQPLNGRKVLASFPQGLH